jgi:hypothetical protein
MLGSQCPECGAMYSEERDSCAARFEELLALDHSRREPWGSRHGQAFAAFALQHPVTRAASLDRAWAALWRITIRDLADFAAETYPARLDAWCRAALSSWGL